MSAVDLDRPQTNGTSSKEERPPSQADLLVALVLSKSDALFAREQKARIRDQSDLEWLEAKWAPGAQSERSGR